MKHHPYWPASDGQKCSICDRSRWNRFHNPSDSKIQWTGNNEPDVKVWLGAQYGYEEGQFYFDMLNLAQAGVGFVPLDAWLFRYGATIEVREDYEP